MWQDIQTVAWKEFMEMTASYRHGGQSKAMVGLGLLFALIAAATVAIGERWLDTAVVFWWMFSAVIVVSSVADSFAGERERHTLETLLASRLPDHTILFGKILMPVLVATGLVGVGILASLIPLNLAHGEDGLLVFTAQQLLMGVLGSLITCLFLAEVGVLVSLRASTVQSAQQRIGIVLLMVMAIPIVAPGLALLFFQERAVAVWEALRDNVTLFQLQLLIFMFLLLLCIGLFSAMWKRFNRAQLILE